MSRFPRQYAESTLNRMYKKLELSDDIIKLLEDYFDAFANLYNILPLEDAFGIINGQNKDLLTKEKFIAFSEIMRHDMPEGRFYYILGVDELYNDAPKPEPMERMIVHESLVDVDYEYFYDMHNAQAGKPLCVLSKEETLKYRDDLYIPQTPQMRTLQKFVREKLRKNKSQAEELAADCYTIITCEDKADITGEIADMLERMKMPMSESQLNEFMGLVYDLNNNTRLPANRGYTPVELSRKYRKHTIPEISFGPNIRDMLQNGELNASDMVRQIEESDLPAQVKAQMIPGIKPSSKVGRNDPCPCGSGKKYKKCCGR